MDFLETLDKDALFVTPIAKPLVKDKLETKLIGLTRKMIEKKLVKRGVKEVGKAIRKGFKGVVIFAADVSPVDVISHLPIQCENKDLPYAFIRSRLELGQAAKTKRPTSVVLLVKPGKDESKLLKKFDKIDKKLRKINEYF